MFSAKNLRAIQSAIEASDKEEAFYRKSVEARFGRLWFWFFVCAIAGLVAVATQ